jgi:hypothetical protein
MSKIGKPYLKIFLYAVLAIVVIGYGANIFAENYLRKYIAQHVLNNDSIPYHIETGKLSVNILTGSVCVKMVSVNSKDSSKSGSNNLIDLQVAEVKISGVSYLKLLFKKSLNINKLNLEHPSLYITNLDTVSNNKDSSVLVNLYTLIQDNLKSMQLNSFKIIEGAITVTSRDTTELLLSLSSFNLELSEISADSTLNTSGRMLEVGALEGEIKDITGHFLKGLYAFKIPALHISSKDGMLSIDSVFLEPTVEKEKFAIKLGYQTDCIQLKLAGFKVYSNSFPEILELGSLMLEKIEISEMKLTDYRDKNLPNAQGVKPMPREMLYAFPVKLSIDQLVLTKATITYIELAAGKSESGSISFSNVKGEITNISNMHLDDTMKINGTGYLMNQAAVSSQLAFPLNGNTFTASVNMGAFDMPILNPMVRNLAPIEIVDGKALSMQMWCAADENSGSGQMTFLYSDLQVNAFAKNESKGKTIITGMKNFVANEIILEKNNPKDEVTRVGKVAYARNPEKNIINYSWNLIFSGFKSSIGLTEEKTR